MYVYIYIYIYIYIWMTHFKKKVWGIKINENLRQRHNKEVMQLLGNSDVLSFIRIRQLNWIGHVNRMGSKRKVSQLSNNNPQGIRPRNRRWNCVKTYINKHEIRNSKKRTKKRS